MKRAMIVLLLLTAGCASRPTMDEYQSTARGWVGRPLDDLVAAWGPPSSAYKMDDGRRAIAYAHTHDEVDAAAGNATTSHYTCAAEFVARDRIESAIVRGNRGGCSYLFRDRASK